MKIQKTKDIKTSQNIIVMAKKTALGRGLGALIESADEGQQPPVQSTQTISDTVEINSNHEIELDKIEANPYQPRTWFDEESLHELAESIKVHGVIQPITVRRKDDSDAYQIISGERRFRASKLAGRETIPAYVRTADDQEMIEMALIENIQRDDLDAIEVAITYQRLIDECQLTQENLGERVGKKRTTVSNYLRLLKLPAYIQQNIRERKISMGHARAIISIDNDKIQGQIAKRIVDEGISVRQTEELVKNLNQPKTEKQKTKPQTDEELPENYCTLVELLELYFNNNINIKRNEKGEGSITINFTSDNEVEEFIEKLSK